MAEEQQFCLRWNNFQANITSQFESLRNEEDFVDVTLACEGNRLRAHKVVLSACSPYFRELFKTNPCKHPILFMRDVEFVHLKSLVEFMYAGEVNVAQAELSTFLRTAESLQIRGLTEAPQKRKEKRKQTVDSSAIASGSLKNNTKNTNGKTSLSDSSNELDDDVDLLPLSPNLSPRPAKKCKFEDRLGPDTSIHLNTITNNSVSENRYQSNNFSSQENSRQEQENIYKSDNTDLLEPKIEVPDYSSDGESKSGTYYGLDNSIDMTNSFNNIQGNSGNFELLPAGSSGNLSTPSDTSPSETNQGLFFTNGKFQKSKNSQGFFFKKNIFKQRRLYEDKNLEDLVKIEENDFDESDLEEFDHENLLLGDEETVMLDNQIEIPRDKLLNCNHQSGSKLVVDLMNVLFTREVMANSSLTGQKTNLNKDSKAKRILNPLIVKAIIGYVKCIHPNFGLKDVKKIIRYKLNNEDKRFKKKTYKYKRSSQSNISGIEII